MDRDEMNQTIIETVKRARMEQNILTVNTFEAEQLFDLRAEAVAWTGIRSGDIVAFETIEITITYTLRPCYDFGFNGQLREVVTDREERVLSSVSYKLRKRQGRLMWDDSWLI